MAVLGLCTDLYEIRMVESYVRLGMFEPATFSLFARPKRSRPWLITAGQDLALDVLDTFQFGTSEIDYLRSQRMSPLALEWLSQMRPTGELWAVDEGTLILGNEPLLEFTAPLPIAQLVETALMNALHYDTLIATQAARLALAAEGRPIVDFGFRRSPGLEKGIRAARAAYIGGIASTSNVEAGRRFGIPIAGTMAHSFVQAFDAETDAFLEFAMDHPDGTTLLVDTYNTLQGVSRAIEVMRRLAPAGVRVRSLRLDSEPLFEDSKAARKMLDDAGFEAVSLFASGGLDEGQIRDLIAAGAPIDAFGIGSALVCSTDHPALDIAYKLVEYRGEGRAKFSKKKQTLPGRKQILRDGSPENDILEIRAESAPEIGLLKPIWRDGQRLWSPDIERARFRARDELSRVPEPWRQFPGLDPPPQPRIGPKLAALAASVAERLHGL